MRQDDRADFIKAMIKEVEDHEGRDHWELVLCSTIPKGIKTIHAIWSFKRKRFPDGTLNKHKARLCAHGGMQQWGENYWETYSPVVNMLTVRLILIIAHVHKLDSKSIDFVLAFPQADLDVDIWMELPRGMVPDHDETNKHLYVLKLKKNLYGLKQASFNWFDKLKTGLMDRDFKPSQIDSCLYYKKGMIVLTYVDDCIIVGNKMKEIDEFVTSMQNGPENFVLTDEGDIDKFLGIEIEHLDDKRFELKLPILRVHQLVNHFLTKILMGNPESSNGSIGLLLECSLICKEILVQKFPWLHIKQQGFAMIQNCLMNKQL
jgi:hypothetical protein